MKFRVSEDLSPGIVRAAGLIKPGRIIDGETAKGNLPKLSLKLQPIDQEAYDALVKDHGEKEVKLAWPNGPVKPPEEKKEDEQMSPAQAAALMSGKGKVRASDSK